MTYSQCLRKDIPTRVPAKAGTGTGIQLNDHGLLFLDFRLSILAPKTGALYPAPRIGAMGKFRKSIYSKQWLTLTDWLVQQRKQADLSQRQLADNIGVVHSLVGKVEKGERRLDPIELVLYCEGMNANPCDLINLIRRGL